MWSLILGLVLKVFDVPKYHNDDGTDNKGFHAQVYRWQTKVALTITACVLMDILLTLFVLFAFGIFGPGFASAGDVDDVKATLIAEKIDDVTALLCMDDTDWRLLNYRGELQKDFRDIKGYEHQAPPCEILLKLRR